MSPDTLKEADYSSRRETFWSLACDMTTFLPFLLVSFSILGVLSIFSLFYVEPGTAASVIIRVNLVLNAVAFAVTAYILHRCGRRRRH